ERTVEFDRSSRGKGDWRKIAATHYLTILGVLVVVTFVATCVKKSRAQVVRIFGATWFIAAYLPISNIVQLNATAAEHWLYLPSVGFLIWAVGCLFQLPTSWRRAIPAVVVLAVIVLSVRSFIRSSDWATLRCGTWLLCNPRFCAKPHSSTRP